MEDLSYLKTSVFVARALNHLCSAKQHSFTNPPNCSTLQSFFHSHSTARQKPNIFSSYYTARNYHTLEIKLCVTMSMLLQVYRRRLYTLKRSSRERIVFKTHKSQQIALFIILTPAKPSASSLCRDQPHHQSRNLE